MFGDESTHKPVLQNDQQTTEMLGYASSQEFERAAFGMMGLTGFCWAMVSIVRISIDCVRVANGNGRAVPQWITTLFDWRISQNYFLSSNPKLLDLLIHVHRYWFEGLLPIVEPFNALFLLAGSIGLHRRYPRTRWWMITFSILTLLKIAVGLILLTIVEWNKSNSEYIYILDQIMKLLESSAGEAVFCIVLFWIMTRPYVASLFHKSAWL